jgi:hypothetical protein
MQMTHYSFLLEHPDESTIEDEAHGQEDGQERRAGGKARRMKLTPYQSDTLHATFERDPQPSMEVRTALADRLGM